ncbi:hypothetical protein PAT3040_00777, partial [Paenibacillus agaridevorans]
PDLDEDRIGSIASIAVTLRQEVARSLSVLKD